MTIDIVGITKNFGNFLALDKIDLQVRDGELLALLGPSGSGKTTLLRIIAGLEAPDDGSILFGGEDALTRHPRDRGVGFVFQHYALFRHMTVFDNVAFGLNVRRGQAKLTKADIRGRVEKLLDLVQLQPLGGRYPNQLSGGQRQRVALARALAVEPQVLLLDEPFGALDAKVRKELRRWLRRLHDEVHVTSVFVTHDQEEALELADRVVVMGHGRIEQVGTPAEVYGAPASAFVCDFLGEVNRLRATVADLGRVRLEGSGTAIGTVPDLAPGPVTVYARHHELDLVPGSGDVSLVPGRLRSIRPVAAAARVEFEVADQLLEAVVPLGRLPELARLPSGSPVGVRFLNAMVFGDGRGDRPHSLLPGSGAVNGTNARLMAVVG